MSETSYFSTIQLYTENEIDDMLENVPAQIWQDGKSTNESKLHGSYRKQNKQNSYEDGVVLKILTRHQQRIQNSDEINERYFIKQITPPAFNLYDGCDNDYYSRHIDKAFMNNGIRTDLACTLGCSDPDSYDGGNLNIQDNYGNVYSVKPKKGQLLIYPCRNPHWVDPVKSGKRISIICWMQSLVRDENRRIILANLYHDIKNVEQFDIDLFDSFATSFAELQRIWFE